MALTREQLEAIVISGRFEELVGEVEGLEFDCKDQPYNLGTDVGKRELAKDVSAFANSEGGFIFIGLKTKNSTSHFGDEVEDVRPFVSSLVNPTQYLDVVTAWVYPEVLGAKVQWVPFASDATKGVVVISVPKQTAVGPFLITKTLDGSKISETVFGYAARKGDRNPPLDVKELQRYLRAGFHYRDKLEERMDAIEALLRRGAEASNRDVAKQGQEKKISQRLESTTKYENLKARRSIVLVANPNASQDLQTIFSSESGSIKRTLEHPPVVRTHGWTMETLDQARIVRGEMLRVANGARKVIDLYRDGTMIFAASAGGDFLAWGKGGEPKINPLALIEVVYSFMILYQAVIADFEKPPEKVSFAVRLLNTNLDGKKSTLTPYGLQSLAQMFDEGTREAPDDNWGAEITVQTDSFDPAAIAYSLVREIYLWFGLEDNKIPYSKEENGIRIVDTQAIINS